MCMERPPVLAPGASPCQCVRQARSATCDASATQPKRDASQGSEREREGGEDASRRDVAGAVLSVPGGRQRGHLDLLLATDRLVLLLLLMLLVAMLLVVVLLVAMVFIAMVLVTMVFIAMVLVTVVMRRVSATQQNRAIDTSGMRVAGADPAGEQLVTEIVQ